MGFWVMLWKKPQLGSTPRLRPRLAGDVGEERYTGQVLVRLVGRLLFRGLVATDVCRGHGDVRGCGATAVRRAGQGSGGAVAGQRPRLTDKGLDSAFCTRERQKGERQKGTHHFFGWVVDF